MVLAAWAAAGTVVGARGGPVLSTLLPSLPARRPPTDAGRPALAPSPLVGAGPGLNGGVCAGRGREPPRPGLERPLQPQGLLCLQKQPELQLEFRKSQVGGGASSGGLEPALTPRCHSKSNGLTPQPCPAPSSHTQTLLFPAVSTPLSSLSSLPLLQPGLSPASHISPAVPLHLASPSPPTQNDLPPTPCAEQTLSGASLQEREPQDLVRARQ